MSKIIRFMSFIALIISIASYSSGILSPALAADSEIKVWVSFDPGVDLFILKGDIEGTGGSVITLAPEGRLLVELGSGSVSALEGVYGVEGVEEYGDLRVSVDGFLPDSGPVVKALGALVSTPEEQELLDGAFVTVSGVDSNEISQMRVSLAGEPAGDPSPAVDNSLSIYFPPIGNQGAQGSCTAWATGYYYATYTQAMDANVNASVGDYDLICSPGFLYPLVNWGGDGGAVTRIVVNMLNRTGCASWTLKPYSQADWTSWPTETAWVAALDWRMTTPTTIGNPPLETSLGCSDEDLIAIKQHLDNGNLAVTETMVFSDWWANYPVYSEGSIDNEVLYAESGSEIGGHALTIVGYDDDRAYDSGKTGAFLIANSWSSDWGATNTGGTDKGFMWVSYDLFKGANKSFGVAYFNVDRDDYSPQLYAVGGINHSQRGYVTYMGGVGDHAAPDWESHEAIAPDFWGDGGISLGVTDANRLAIDLTDGISSISDQDDFYLYISMGVSSSSSINGSISSAEFFLDFDGDGSFESISSPDPMVIAPHGETGYATVHVVRPTVSMASALSDPTNVSPVPVTVTFSEDVTGFDVSDISASNGTVSNFSVVNGAVYTFDLTPDNEGSVTADIADSVAVSAEGFGNVEAPQFSINYDITQPSVGMSSTAPSVTATSPIPVSVAFSEDVTGFDASDISATNASVENFTPVSASEYTFNLYPVVNGLVTADIGAGVTNDLSGNGNTAAPQFSRTFNTDAPIVSMSSPTSASTSVTPIPVTATFSEDVTGFDVGDVVASNGSVSDFAVVSASVYTFNLIPAGEGAVTADIAAAVAQDSDTNPNLEAPQFVRLFDSIAPTVGMTSTTPATTNTSPIPVTVTFSEDVNGFTVSDISTSNAAVSGFTVVSASEYTFNLTPAGQGTVTADIAGAVALDLAGNPNSAATQFVRIYDSISPTVAMSSTAPTVTNQSPIDVTVTFSEDVIGFTVTDITALNGSISNFTTVNASEYTFDLTPSSQGVVRAYIIADVTGDSVGNGNTAATDFVRTCDTVSPSLTINSETADNTNISPIPVTVTFTEDVTGFSASDLLISNCSVSGFTAVSGSVYTFNLVPAGQGELTVDMPAAYAKDIAGNDNTVSDQFVRIYDSIAPGVLMNIE